MLKEETKKLLKVGVKMRGTPPYVYHPLYQSEFYEIDGKKRSVVNYGDRTFVEEMFCELIDSKNSAKELMELIREDFKLKWLESVRPHISNKEFSELLGIAWTNSSCPNIEVVPEIAAEWFRNANKKALMGYREYGEFRKLPSRKKLYRTIANGASANGLSWTDDADWAKERGDVLVSYVAKEDIFAVFERFGVKEYVAQPKKLTQLNSKE